MKMKFKDYFISCGYHYVMLWFLIMLISGIALGVWEMIVPFCIFMNAVLFLASWRAYKKLRGR